MQFIPKYGVSADENNSHSPNSTRSFAETQLEIFHHRHGLLILHLLAALMFVPSLVAWIQVSTSNHSGGFFPFPRLLLANLSSINNSINFLAPRELVQVRVFRGSWIPLYALESCCMESATPSQSSISSGFRFLEYPVGKSG